MQDASPHSLTLVLGGARSGKSTYAQALAAKSGSVLFLATAVPGDSEMRAKIARHRQDRVKDHLDWQVVEEPVHLANHIRSTTSSIILIDCLTLWIGNILTLAHRQTLVQTFLDSLAQRTCPIVLVSNEVGSGVVPDFASGRAYRDLLGETNQRVAALATDVLLMVAGLPLALKGRA